MEKLNSNVNKSMLPVQRYAERIFQNYIDRLTPLVKDNHISFTDLVRITDEIVQDQELLTQIATDEICAYVNDIEQMLDARTEHFKRFVIHQLILNSGVDKTQPQYEQIRYWFLHLIEIIEIALGQFRFQESQQACESWIEEHKTTGHFSFHQFFTSKIIMQLYVVLIFQLAIFLASKPKHRISWLLHSMESNPTSRIEFGLEIHINSAIEPPKQKQTLALLKQIFEKLLTYINDNELRGTLSEKFPQLATEPTVLLEQLLIDLNNGVGCEDCHSNP